MVFCWPTTEYKLHARGINNSANYRLPMRFGEGNTALLLLEWAKPLSLVS
ncbi:hypothetical protein O9929_04490 [Vibrio lentus]|nr:hypothetical protein [Vibrio lentus]